MDSKWAMWLSGLLGMPRSAIMKTPANSDPQLLLEILKEFSYGSAPRYQMGGSL